MKHQIVIDHINFSVKNFEDTKSWYRNLFGFQLVEEGRDEEGKPWGILRNGDHMLCIYEESQFVQLDSKVTKQKDIHQIFHFGIRVRDEAEWKKILEQHNPKILYGGSVRYPHSKSWYLEDPSGYEIEVSYWDKDEVIFN